MNNSFGAAVVLDSSLYIRWLCLKVVKWHCFYFVPASDYICMSQFAPAEFWLPDTNVLHILGISVKYLMPSSSLCKLVNRSTRN